MFSSSKFLHQLKKKISFWKHEPFLSIFASFDCQQMKTEIKFYQNVEKHKSQKVRNPKYWVVSDTYFAVATLSSTTILYFD